MMAATPATATLTKRKRLVLPSASLLSLLLAPLLLPACSRKTSDTHKSNDNSGMLTASSASAAGLEQETESAPAPLACPPDMVLVDGLFCPQAQQDCLAYEPQAESVPDRCHSYVDPSRCLSQTRVLMRFCVDRFEWPNELGKKPLVLVNWGEAASLCESEGKRLCDEQEWLFACEGEKMLPYAYGFTRDPTTCVMDRLYVERTYDFSRYDECMESEQCRAEFDKVDQREPSGSFKQCVSPFGAYDMNGNVNEWVNIPDETYPKRSGLKGGWWGPVRDRCRPTVRFHGEEDWGYEVGFRCCRNAIP